ncbi:hypothetical protein EDEG_00266 [Edhazardia aedis USNM 41457]|uniref:ABC transporter domain-containing protein n=1 Tax=Edhazardia aedis (strain USNM 41457) TaxID=1003232 RepID=J9DMQ4_EDHAE|nr:hypothetical protein EDEG_00266 [Edhazardia aedis USNM 41457]|eukprot:EJW02612.1 hypothetical protein EDEG_00266 [Edhazardia aedis USNM 41457]
MENCNQNENLHIVFKNITVRVKIKGEWKTILNDISGNLPKGKLTAILGESGSGKTTLMHILCGMCHYSSNYEVDGEILVNGKPRDPNTWFKQFGLVRQTEHFNELETVYECIENAARLNYKRNDAEFIGNICDKYLDILNIDKIRNSRIKIISGGEKKRLSIACVLLREPEILFLDEPFSGLDYNNSLNLGNLMKHISEKLGTTLTAVIHTGPKELMDKFDAFIYLNLSEPVFVGSIKELEQKYKKIGYTISENTSHLEHLTMLSQTKSKFFETKDNIDTLNRFKTLYREDTVNITEGKNKKIHLKRIYSLTPSFPQVWTLMRRRLRATYLKGFKRVFWKIVSLSPIFLFFLYFIIFKSAKDNNINYDDVSAASIMTKTQRSDCGFIYTHFCLINSILLGHLWGIYKGDYKVTKDELTLGKYNPVTYITYVIAYALSYIFTILIFLSLPMCFCVVNGRNVIILILKYIAFVLPVALLVSLGVVFIFSLINYCGIIKFIYQHTWLFAFIFADQFNPVDPTRKWYKIVADYWPNLFPFLYLTVHTDLLLYISGDKILEKSKAGQKFLIDISNSKKNIMGGHINPDKFYYMFSFIIAALLVLGIIIQFFYRVPKYRI